MGYQVSSRATIISVVSILVLLEGVSCVQLGVALSNDEMLCGVDW